MLRSFLVALMSLSLVVGGSVVAYPGPTRSDDQKPEDKKPEDKKPDDKKPEDKKPEEPKKPDDKKPEDKKPEDKKPDDKKPEEPKKPDDKKPEDKKPEDKKAEETKKVEPERRGAATKKSTRDAKIKPFDEIITSDAKTDSGLFIVHRIEEKILYEIPSGSPGQRLLVGDSNREDGGRQWLRRITGG